MWIELVLLGGVTFLLYQLLKPPTDFWKQYGVPQLHTSSFADKVQMFLGQKTLADFDDIAYKKLRSSGGKFCGLVELRQPLLLVTDLDMVKKILIKDFDHFVDRRRFINGSQKQMVANKMIGNLEGEEWKGVRSSLSPTFTTGKIRRMMDHFNQSAIEWTDHLKEKIAKLGKSSQLPVNIHSETVNFAVDAIASAVFGMNAGAIRNPESIFAQMAHKIAGISYRFLLATQVPRLMKLFGIALFDEEATAFFENILIQGMKARMEGQIKRNDFMQLIAEARKGALKSVGADELSSFEKEAQLGSASVPEKKINYLNDDETANAQALVFFLAGFSTTSNFIGFVLYMLALHPEIQNRLREEVDSQLFSEGDDGKNIDYDKLNNLVYLDMVVCEVLRKFPAIFRLERKCVKEYHDPSENLRVPKDVYVGIPVHSIHHDKEFYDRPDDFHPEHFSAENKAKRSPYAFMPFGSGPRNCIGMRFALVESKAAIAHLVHSFQIEPTAKTPVPVQVKNAGLGVQIPDGLELGFRLL